MKSYLRLRAGDHPDDDLLTQLLDAATWDVERYTGRDLRVNAWTLHTDEFDNPITLRRDPVDSITTVKYYVATVLTTITSTVYYHKKGPQYSELFLAEDQVWPSDIDSREHGIQIAFATVAHTGLALAQTAIMRLVAYQYGNRGDDDGKTAVSDIEGSGADSLLLRMRIPRL
jgi:uncharacterized phiE125 gp8 family phage protein